MEDKSADTKKIEEQITRLRKLARKTHEKKLRQRYDIVRLFLLGKEKKEIAQRCRIAALLQLDRHLWHVNI